MERFNCIMDETGVFFAGPDTVRMNTAVRPERGGTDYMRTLNISSSRPGLDITSNKAQLQIKQTVRRHFTAKRTPPQMKVERSSPRMKVNWKKVWNDRGTNRSPEYFRKHLVQQGYQKVQGYIQKTSQDGEFMAALEEYYGQDINRIGQLAYRDAIHADIPEIQVAAPIESPEVEWEKGSMTIEWIPGDLEIVWEEDFRPQITVTPHSVEIRLRGKNEVKISVNEDKVSRGSGKNVDRRV